MALSSMTGFARADGVSGAYVWAWELKSVNAKGLELRLRLPPGWDAVEAPLRARAAEILARGTVHANLTAQRAGVAPVVRVNEPVLAAVLSTMRDVAKRIEAAPPAIDGILALKGVIEVLDEDEREEDRRAAEAADHRRLLDRARKVLPRCAGARATRSPRCCGRASTRSPR